MPVYGTAQAAYARDNSSSFKDVRLAPGDKKVAFAAPPDESKLPSEAAPGDILTGTAGLCRSAANSEGPSRRPAAGLLYQVPPRSNKTAKKDRRRRRRRRRRPRRRPRPRRAPAACWEPRGRRSTTKRPSRSPTRRQRTTSRSSRRARWRTPRPTRSGKRWLPTTRIVRQRARAALSRAASAAAPGWDGKNGTAPIANATAAVPVEAAAAELMKVLDVDAIKAARATRDIDDTSFGNDTAAKDAARAARKKANEDHAALLAAKRWTAEAALAKGDAAAFEGAMRSLDEWVDTAKSTAADARLRAHRFGLRGQPGLAVRDLGVWLDADAKKKSGAAAAADVAALRELRRDLMAGLGWERPPPPRRRSALRLPEPRGRYRRPTLECSAVNRGVVEV